MMPSLFKPSDLMKSTLSLLILIATTVPLATVAEPTNIIDLSKPFPIGNVNNLAAKDFEENWVTRDVRRFLVLDNGEVVIDYQRDTVTDDTIYELWSATKSVMSMIIGTILHSDEYDLSLNDTLGDIFTNENDWSEIEDEEEVEFKKNITIFEMLTMTSGLWQVNPISNPFSMISLDPLNPLDPPNTAGINLEESLAFNDWNATYKGEMHYVYTSNILSYVILAVTGMTPMEYASVDIWPSLGIDPNKIQWDQNHQGVEASFSNLKMTARDMAKFAQLYLQKGKSAPDKQLVAEEHVRETITTYAYWDVVWPYGYLWTFSTFDKEKFPNTIGDGAWCGYGLFAQDFCFNYESNRVVAFQRSNSFIGRKEQEDFVRDLAQAAFSANFTFEVTADEEETVEESGAFSRQTTAWGILLLFAPIALACIAASSCVVACVWL